MIRFLVSPMVAGLLLILAGSIPSQAEKRVALVVANGAYANVALVNPGIDADIVASALAKMAFEVSVARDVDLVGFDEAVSKFQAAAKGADIALFYFAGHGFALKDGLQNRSFLMSTSADITAKSDVVIKSGGLALDDILNRLNGQARTTLVFIDACRKGVSGRGTGEGRGFDRFDSSIAQQVFVGMSTRLGTIAGDGDAGKGSPFAQAFAAKMPTPGLRIDDAFRAVRDMVKLTTGGSQVPDAVQDDLQEGAIVLIPASATVAGTAAAVPTPSPRGDPAPAAVAVIVPPAIPPSIQPELACDLLLVKVGAGQKCLKVGDSFRDLEGGPEMVILPPGTFTMGSPPTEKDRDADEGPQHDVTFAKPLAMAKYDVTRGEYAAFVKATGYESENGCYTWAGKAFKEQMDKSWRDPGFEQTDRHPVTCVNWNDANAYVVWLSQQTGQDYHLPSEAEFEYAVRGRTKPARQYSRFWFGDSEKALCANVNGADDTARKALKLDFDTSCSDQHVFTTPVGSYTANGFGLYDMTGDVWQWTADCYQDSYKGVPSDGSSATTQSCDMRVLRGGSWYDGPWDLRAAERFGTAADGHDATVGFRVARTW